MYTTGTEVGNGLFSRDIAGPIVADFAFTASRISERRWKRILDLCGAQEMEQRVVSLKRPASFNRRTMYEPSSPTKMTDED
jgi:hypothetical protein